MCKKNKAKTLWGNGVGIDPKLWFNKPKKFVTKFTTGYLGITVKNYVPIGDKKSNFFNGGYCIKNLGLHLEYGSAIVCLSENYNEVLLFTKIVKKMLNYNTHWQSSFFKELKIKLK